MIVLGYNQAKSLPKRFIWTTTLFTARQTVLLKETGRLEPHVSQISVGDEAKTIQCTRSELSTHFLDSKVGLRTTTGITLPHHRTRRVPQVPEHRHLDLIFILLALGAWFGYRKKCGVFREVQIVDSDVLRGFEQKWCNLPRNPNPVIPNTA